MTHVLMIAQTENGKLSPVMRNAIGGALKISNNIDVLLACNEDHCSEEIAALEGVKKVRVFQNPILSHPLAEDLSTIIQSLLKQYTHVMAPATTFGKNVIPRAAALCNGACISDISEVISPNTFVRPIYAGNAFETIEVNHQPMFITIRPTAFSPVGTQSTLAPIEVCDIVFTPFEKTRFVSRETPQQERPDLSSAKIVLAGGRAFKNAENFKLLEALADQLGAAIGATRAAVDAGFAPNDWQVGQTGKVVAPNLYMAFGISGAIQHIAGIKESKIIVAINQDAEAPIFQIADYGLVGDIFTILPELSQALKKP